MKDGILLPWEVEEMPGTIFIISHVRDEAFDTEDLHLMQVLADFAAMRIRQQRQTESCSTKPGHLQPWQGPMIWPFKSTILFRGLRTSSFLQSKKKA